MTEPAEFDAEATPTVTLAGKEWPVPELAWTQLKLCRAALLEVSTRINAATRAAKAPKSETASDRLSRELGLVTKVFAELSDEDYDRLIMAPLHAGLTALHPELKRAEFDAWRSTEFERQMAWFTLRRQSGLFVFRGEPTPEDDPGEGQGVP